MFNQEETLKRVRFTSEFDENQINTKKAKFKRQGSFIKPLKCSEFSINSKENLKKHKAWKDFDDKTKDLLNNLIKNKDSKKQKFLSINRTESYISSPRNNKHFISINFTELNNLHYSSSNRKDSSYENNINSFILKSKSFNNNYLINNEEKKLHEENENKIKNKTRYFSNSSLYKLEKIVGKKEKFRKKIYQNFSDLVNFSNSSKKGRSCLFKKEKIFDPKKKNEKFKSFINKINEIYLK